jgi:hypothetical protein
MTPDIKVLRTAFALLFNAVVLANPSLQAQAALTSPKSLVSDSVRLSDRRTQEAATLWQKQAEALRTGDIKRVARFWNRDEAERGAVYDRRYESFQKYRATVRRLYDKIVAASVVDATAVEAGCVRLIVHWLREPDAKPFAAETVFMFWENGKPVLAHALAAFTRNWSVQKTGHVVFRHPGGAAPIDPDRMARVENLVQSFAKRFQIKPIAPIPYYAFPVQFDLSRFKEWGLSKMDMGEAMNRLAMVVDWGRNPGLADHEIIHVLQSRLVANAPCTFLLEGTAVYFGGDMVPQDSLFQALKRGLKRPSPPSLDSLICKSYSKGNETQAGDQWLKAMGAASVGYLNETWGEEQFRRFYAEASSGRHKNAPAMDLVESLKNVYGLTVSGLDQQVRAWLADRTE